MTAPTAGWWSVSSVGERLGPLVFVALVLLVAIGGLAVGLGALAQLSTVSQHGLQLRAWGVLGEDEVLTVMHDHSRAGDGSSGCLVTGAGRLVRWDDGAPTASVTLQGAGVRRSGYPDYAISVQGTDGKVVCPCRDEADVRWLHDGVLVYTADPGTTSPHRPLQSD